MSDITLDFRCFICNLSEFPVTEGVSIFDENAVLGSGLRLSEAVSQILGRVIEPHSDHSPVICKKCHKTCEEYDEINKRLSTIKSKFRQTVPPSDISYDTYAPTPLPATTKVDLETNVQTQTVNKPMKKIVLSKSKMTPLPANYVFLNTTKAVKNDGTKPVPVFVSPTKPMVIASSAALAKQTKTTTNSVKTIANMPASNVLMLNPYSQTPVATIKQPGRFANQIVVDGTNKIIKTPNVIKTQNALNVNSTNGKSVKTPTKTSNTVETIPVVSRQGRPQQNRDEYVISEVEVLDDDDCDEGEADTILMDEDGSILQVLRGNQRNILSQVNEISLVLPQEGDKSDDSAQIELQVSGDEAAANAIINAAKEQGTTFIKMSDSDELYEVESVHSAEANEKISDPEARAIVERVGTSYKCLVCKTSKDSESCDSESGNTEKQVKLYVKPSDIMIHMKKAHHLRLYVCTVCGDSFRRRTDYEDHLAEHEASANMTESKKKPTIERPRQYSCSICSKKYISKNLLDEHMNIHTGVRPYCCSICDKGFANKYTLQAHIKTHNERPRPFECDKCSKTFLSFQNMMQHEKTHCGIKEFTCKICKKSFATNHNLETHMVVHSGSKPYVCGVCEKGFARRAEIRDHLRTHTGERPFACDICGQRFAQNSNMYSHRRTIHFDDRRFSCTQCDKRFKRRRLLNYHIRSVHTGERPYKCKLCKASFVYPEHYKKHLLTHNGEKPYKCEVCNRSFNSRDNRNAHRFTHSDKKPYECLVCGVGYMRKPQLYAHMTAQGHLADMIVVNQARLSNDVGTVAVMELHKAEESMVNTSVNNAQTSAEPIDPSMCDIFSEKNFIKKITESSIKSESGDNINEVDNVMTVDGAVLTLTEGTDEGVVDTQDLLSSEEMDQLLAQGSEMITTDEEGNIMRLVQIQLPDGKSGWVALDTCGTTVQSLP